MCFLDIKAEYLNISLNDNAVFLQCTIITPVVTYTCYELLVRSSAMLQMNYLSH